MHFVQTLSFFEGLQPCAHLANGHLDARLGLQIGCEGGGLHGQSAVVGKNQPATFQGHLASSAFEEYVCGSIFRVYTLAMIIKTMTFMMKMKMMMMVVLAVTLVVIGSVWDGEGGLTDTICHKPNIPSPLSPG